jgi:hypothetical protein
MATSLQERKRGPQRETPFTGGLPSFAGPVDRATADTRHQGSAFDIRRSAIGGDRRSTI